jgi:type IV secretory pathway VirB2 component (pilin)
MFTGWIYGFIGSSLVVIGTITTGIVILSGLINSDRYWLLIFTIPLIALGSYLKYNSEHSVKIRH